MEKMKKSQDNPNHYRRNVLVLRNDIESHFNPDHTKRKIYADIEHRPTNI